MTNWFLSDSSFFSQANRGNKKWNSSRRKLIIIILFQMSIISITSLKYLTKKLSRKFLISRDQWASNWQFNGTFNNFTFLRVLSLTTRITMIEHYWRPMREWTSLRSQTNTPHIKSMQKVRYSAQIIATDENWLNAQMSVTIIYLHLSIVIELWKHDFWKLLSKVKIFIKEIKNMNWRKKGVNFVVIFFLLTMYSAFSLHYYFYSISLSNIKI